MHGANNASLAWPLSCILKGCRIPTSKNKRESSRSKDRLKAPEKEAQARLSPTRERCPPSPLPDDGKPTSSQEPRYTKMEQTQSMFMSKLPLELRTMIYVEVLCRPVPIVHITTRKDGKLGFFRCKAADGRCRGLECFHGPNEDLYSTWRTRDKDLFSTWSPSHLPAMADGGGLLAILQTCQQMSVPILLKRARSQGCILLTVYTHIPATPKR